jgi:hypothetical protein
MVFVRDSEVYCEEFEAEGLRNSTSIGRFTVYIADTDLHTIIVMEQKNRKVGSKNPWHTFLVPYSEPFGGSR